MKVAIPEWRGRVSPVFDVARNLILVEVGHGTELTRWNVRLAPEGPAARAECLARLGLDVLICGAISRPLEMTLSAARVRVISQTCGDVEQVLSAFIAGRLNGDAFLMPGCCRRRQGARTRGRRGNRWRGTGQV